MFRRHRFIPAAVACFVATVAFAACGGTPEPSGTGSEEGAAVHLGTPPDLNPEYGPVTCPKGTISCSCGDKFCDCAGSEEACLLECKGRCQ